MPNLNVPSSQLITQIKSLFPPRRTFLRNLKCRICEDWLPRLQESHLSSGGVCSSLDLFASAMRLINYHLDSRTCPIPSDTTSPIDCRLQYPETYFHVSPHTQLDQHSSSQEPHCWYHWYRVLLSVNHMLSTQVEKDSPAKYGLLAPSHSNGLLALPLAGNTISWAGLKYVVPCTLILATAHTRPIERKTAIASLPTRIKIQKNVRP